jgi:hypothetical protein
MVLSRQEMKILQDRGIHSVCELINGTMSLLTLLIHRFRRLHRLQRMCDGDCEICRVYFPAACCVRIEIIIHRYPAACRGEVHWVFKDPDRAKQAKRCVWLHKDLCRFV